VCPEASRSQGGISPYVSITREVEAIHAQAFHEGEEWYRIACRRQQAVQLIRRDDHDCVVAANGHALGSFSESPSDHLAELRLGVLQLPASWSVHRLFAGDYLTR
jgi:hypothetical protein